MGTPADRKDWVLSMFDWAGQMVTRSVLMQFPSRNTEILDVGAGWGKYGWLLRGYYHRVDAVEVWKESLDPEPYKDIIIGDICDVAADLPAYDVMIFGDVFEHIERARANELLDVIWTRCDQLFIVVPWEMEQGIEDNNPFEEHKQDDLTPEVMAREYPKLHLLVSSKEKGLYIKGEMS
jgi:hypothetical protein